MDNANKTKMKIKLDVSFDLRLRFKSLGISIVISYHKSCNENQTNMQLDDEWDFAQIEIFVLIDFTSTCLAFSPICFVLIIYFWHNQITAYSVCGKSKHLSNLTRPLWQTRKRNNGNQIMFSVTKAHKHERHFCFVESIKSPLQSTIDRWIDTAINPCCFLPIWKTIRISFKVFPSPNAFHVGIMCLTPLKMEEEEEEKETNHV